MLSFVNTQYKNKHDETPLELLRKVNEIDILNDTGEVILTQQCSIKYE